MTTIKANSPELWDNLFDLSETKSKDTETFAKEELTVRFARIRQIIKKHFGSLKGLQVIEIGAGQGTIAALMAKEGAKITLLDYSEKALKRSREFFENNDINATYVKANALELPKDLLGKYDISMSYGLVEHFKNEERKQINKSHFDVLRKGGLTFISAPNKYCPPYRIYKYIAEKTGKWLVGEEYPYSKKEFKKICKDLGFNNVDFTYDSFLASWHFINPNKILKKIVKINIKYKAKPEKSTLLDRYMCYALVLVGVKE